MIGTGTGEDLKVAGVGVGALGGLRPHSGMGATRLSEGVSEVSPFSDTVRRWKGRIL